MQPLFLVTFAMLAAIFGSGCASPALPRDMQTHSIVIEQRQPFTITVQAEGGRRTGRFLSASEISNDALAEAVRKSISESGLFREVVPSGKADYQLDVGIESMSAPGAAFNMTVTLTVGWRLTQVATRKLVFVSETTESYTATVGDALMGIKRLRLAEEGAARKNIQVGLQRISQLNLKEVNQPVEPVNSKRKKPDANSKTIPKT